MSSEPAQFNQKFKQEIRRRQRQDIMKVSRQMFLHLQKKERQKQLVKTNSEQNLATSNVWSRKYTTIKQLYQVFIQQTNFLDKVSEQQLQCIINQLLKLSSLQTIQGASLVGTMIQYCGSLSVKAENKKKIIRNSLEEAKIQLTIFQLALKCMKTLQHKQLKIYLYCIKNMALIRMERLISKQILQIYMPQLIQHLTTQPTVLIFLTFVSQQYVFSTNLIKSICDQASSKQKNTKIFVLTILNNYIALEQNSQNIHELFQKIMKTLSHLYISCKQYSPRYSITALNLVTRLISKFPQNKPLDLLQKIKHVKLQDIMIVMLTVSSQQTKCIVYQIQQTIVDKTIHQLRQDFFIHFSTDIIEQIFMGLQYCNSNIVGRALKIIAKMLTFAPKQLIIKFDAQYDAILHLEDLLFHKSEYISSMAEQILKYFPRQNQNDMEMNDL